jgi:hypothetical protein
VLHLLERCTYLASVLIHPNVHMHVSIFLPSEDIVE